MKNILMSVALIALLATGAHAQESLDHASQASGHSVVATARLSEAGVKVVAGVAAVPLQYGGFSAAAPGALVAYSGYTNDDSVLLFSGMAAAAPGIVVAYSGQRLDEFSKQPLQISAETLTGRPAPKTEKTR